MKSRLPSFLRTLLIAPLFSAQLLAQAHWPDFRGPYQDGSAPAQLATQWSETQNIAWKIPIHGRAWSTPAIADKQIWLTTATPDGKKLSGLCIDADSGKISFDQVLFQIPKPQFAHAFNSYASPSPVIDGPRVYLSFGSPGTACLDRKSHKVLWQRDDFVCDHFRGAGSSPFLYKHLLILTMDGADKQYLVALDKITGKTVWKTDRSTDFADLDPNTGKPKRDGDMRKCYSTPVIAKVNGKDQLICPGAKAAFAYEPLSGKEIWSIRYANHSSASRVVLSQGLAFINTGYAKAEIHAVELGGKGDVTDTHVRWRLRKGAPNKPSPVVKDGHLYTVTDGGVASCIHAQSGEIRWQERIGGEYSASLILAGENVYCFDQTGGGVIFKAQPSAFALVSKTKLEGGFMASPAVLGQDLVLRTKTHLYRISK